MSELYEVTVRTSVCVLAHCTEEAERIVQALAAEAQSSLPHGFEPLSCSAYRTPNQELYLRKQAINFEPTERACPST